MERLSTFAKANDTQSKEFLRQKNLLDSLNMWAVWTYFSGIL